MRAAVTTADRSSSGENSSRPIALIPARQARPRRTCRSKAASSPLLEQQPERDVERDDQRDRRRERAVELLPAPRASAPSRSRSSAASSARPAPRRRRRRRRSRARAASSAPSASRRRRRRGPSRPSPAARRRDSRRRRRRPARPPPWRRPRAPECRRRHRSRSRSGRGRRARPARSRRACARDPPAVGVSPHAYVSSSTSQPNVRAIVAQRSPNEPAETASTRSPGEQRLTIADSNAPVPEQVKRSTSACGAVDFLQPAEHARVDLAEVRRAVVQDRLRERGEHLRRHRGRPGREQVPLLRHARRLAVRRDGPLRSSSMEALLAFGAALVALRLAGMLAARWRRRRQPQLALWSAGLAAYALGAAAIAWGAAGGWNDGVFRAYYLFGGLAHGSVARRRLAGGRRRAGGDPGRAPLHGARGRRRARRSARGAAQRHVDPGSAAAPRRSSRLASWRSSATSPARWRSSASPSPGSAGDRSGNALLLAGFALAAAGSAVAGLGAAQTAAFVALAACLLYAGSVARQ